MENKKLLRRIWEYATADSCRRAKYFSEFDARLRFHTNPPIEEIVMLLKEKDRLDGHGTYSRGQTWYNGGHVMVLGTTCPVKSSLGDHSRSMLPSQYILTPKRGTSRILINNELSLDKGCLLGETWNNPKLYMNLKADEILIGLGDIYKKGLPRVFSKEGGRESNKKLMGEIGRIYGGSFS